LFFFFFLHATSGFCSVAHRALCNFARAKDLTDALPSAGALASGGQARRKEGGRGRSMNRRFAQSKSKMRPRMPVAALEEAGVGPAQRLASFVFVREFRECISFSLSYFHPGILFRKSY
jgi:hypothetical protein